MQPTQTYWPTVDASEIRDQVTSWGRLVVEIYHCFTRFEHHPNGDWPWDFWTINCRFVWKMSVLRSWRVKPWSKHDESSNWVVYDDLLRSVGNLKCVENSCWNWSKNIQKLWSFSKDVAVWSRFMSHEFTLVLSRYPELRRYTAYIKHLALDV